MARPTLSALFLGHQTFKLCDIRLNEAETLLSVKPSHRADWHLVSPTSPHGFGIPRWG
jgi:hypothetical protein